MDTHEQRPVLSNGDEQRQTPTAERSTYTLPIVEVAERFDAAGIARTERTLLRYCADGKLDCSKVESTHGEKYFASEISTERLIAEIKRKEQFTRPTDLGQPRPTTVGQAEEIRTETAGQSLSDSDERRQANSTANEDQLIGLLRDQLAVKDEQIRALLERDKESNLLVHGLQNLVLQLQAARPQEGEGGRQEQRPEQAS